MKKSLLTAVAVACTTILSVDAAPFTMGNLVVVQVGADGSGSALNSNATAAFLKEFTTAGGAPVQTIALPTAASGSNAALTLSGSATSEGFLKLSTNGQYLTVAGYGTAPGTSSVASTASATVNRVVGVVDMLGNIDTTTALNNAHSAGNIRAAITSNGTDIWTSGSGSTTAGLAPGVTYTTLGSTTATRINTAGASGSNRRVVNIFNGQLYVSGQSTGGPNQSVNTVGTGLPTGPDTEANIPGLPTAAGPSIYDFWFKDANTLYLADDGSAASGGGIQKWTFDGSTWSLAYIMLNDGSSRIPSRGLTGYVDGLGNAVLFATTALSASANTLITVTDAGVDVDTATVLATAPSNTAFRGVAYLPIPEPASLGLLAFAAISMMRRRVN